MDSKIPVAQLPGGYAFFQGTGFGSRSVLVRTADVQGFITGQPAKPGKGVGGQHLNQVSQMGDIVDIGQRGGNQSSFHVLHGSRKRGEWGVGKKQEC